MEDLSKEHSHRVKLPLHLSIHPAPVLKPLLPLRLLLPGQQHNKSLNQILKSLNFKILLPGQHHNNSLYPEILKFLDP